MNDDRRLRRNSTRTTAAISALSVLALTAGSAFAQCSYDLIEPEAWTETYWRGDAEHRAQFDVEATDSYVAMGCGRWATIESPDPASLARRGILVHRVNGDGTLEFEQLLMDPDATDDELQRAGFGTAIAMHGDRLAAVAHRPGGARVFVFERDREWTLAATIDVPDVHNGTEVMTPEIELSDQHLMVYARNQANTPQIMDTVYIFEVDGNGVWSQTQVIQNPSGADDAHFGQSMSLDGERLAIGAWNHQLGGFKYGSVYFYDYSTQDEQWELTDSIHAQSFEENGLGNPGMVLRGDTLVATTGYHTNSIATGYFHVFDDSKGTGWERTTQIPIPIVPGQDADAPGYISRGLDFDGDTAAIVRVAEHAHEPGGTLHFARIEDGTWTLGDGVRPNHRDDQQGPGPGHRIPMISGFGMDVALTQGRALVGASLFLRMEQYRTKPLILSYDTSDDLGIDINENGICDDREFMSGALETDINLNGIDDELEITLGLDQDCNGNGIPDSAEPDCNGDGIPNDCEEDCNDNGVPDVCESQYPFSEFGDADNQRYTLSSFHASQVLLRRIIVEPGGEVVTRFTMQRSSTFDGTRFRLYVLRDPDGDGDAANAEIAFVQEFRFGDLSPSQATTIDLPDVVLGDVGDAAFIGIEIINASDVEAYILLGSYDSGGDTNGFAYGNVSTPLDIESLGEADMSLTLNTIVLPFKVHTGPIGTCCTATDFDENGSTDIGDLLAILAQWGACDAPCAIDVVHDGVVDVQDLLLVLQNWGDCSP